ncbi:MAG: class I SAM-dependent DNA methyltransferase, partial [Pseudanabaenaceae cyanobacterium]
GIEIRHFAAEIARLALVIAEYQCNVLYLGKQQASLLFLPLKKENWITCGNALRLDWLALCPPTGKGVAVQREDLDLWQETKDEAEIDFQNEGGETYICGNPPYLGSTWQSKEQKDDLKQIFEGRAKNWKSLDYVAGWFMKAADYGTQTKSAAAFVSTNSICQGQQVPILWSLIFKTGHEINFAHTSFKWENLASHNAGVTVVIVGIAQRSTKIKYLFSLDEQNKTISQEAKNINAYLVAGSNVIVEKAAKPLTNIPEMSFGNKPVDGGNLLLSRGELEALNLTKIQYKKFIRHIYGSAEFIRGLSRYCLWIEDEYFDEALEIKSIKQRIEGVREMRLASCAKDANALAVRPHQMREMNIGKKQTVAIAAISSENREFLPCGLLNSWEAITNKLYALYDAPLWNMALIASRLHWVWIGTVCVRMRTDFSYSNTLGWNTFPVPFLTEQNKQDLTHCAEDILLAREEYFPATIAEMYDPNRMDQEFPLVRQAHERNDDILERIYIGRRFKNDTERLEKLFEMYTKMTGKQ